MRPLPALAALVTLLAAAAPAAAITPIPAGRATILAPDGAAPHESARLRFTPRDDGRTLGVDVDVVYPAGAKLPPQDVLYISREEPAVLEARTDDGRALAARVTGAPGVTITLPREGERPPRGVHVSLEQAAPPVRRYGWRYGLTEIRPSAYRFEVTRDVITSVVLPEGVRLPGFDCRRIDGRSECTRTTPGHFDAVPLVLPAPLDLLGVALLLLTMGASGYGFERMRRKRAAEHVEHARVIAPAEQPPQEVPGGAYREPPARAVVPPAGDATEALATLNRRARWLAAAVIASTVAVAVLAAGRSPWPMPSVTAAWIAVIGFTAALVVERL